MRGKKKLLLIFFLILGSCLTSQAASKDSSGTDDAGSYDYSGAQEVMDEALEGELPSFSEMVSALTEGNIGEFLKGIPGYLKEGLLSEILLNKRMLGQVLLLAAFGTIFSGLAVSFRDRQAGEAGFYVTYLLLLSLLLNGFGETAQIAKQTVEAVTGFVAALLPAFTLSVASAGKTMTSLFSYELIMIAVSVTQWLFRVLFFPAIQIYVVLTLVNHISKEEILTKMTELLQMLIGWGMKTLIGLVVGYSAIQSLVLPLADSMKTGAVTKALSMIPGIGGGAGAAAGLITGTAALIKNGIGMAALIVLVLICALPVVKLAAITLLYYGAAAMMQPVADERITECLSGVAGGVRFLLKMTVAAVGMFLLMIGILCAFSSVQI